MITIEELLKKREEIEAAKSARYVLTTSLGEILIRLPGAGLISESLAKNSTLETNCFLIYNCVETPDLHDAGLQKAYGCFAPADIVKKIFSPGEIVRISDAIFRLSGYESQIGSKLYEEIKN